MEDRKTRLGRFRVTLFSGALLLCAGMTLVACGRSPSSDPTSDRTSVVGSTASSPAAPVYTARVEQVFPHDTRAFTEGLVFLDGVLYESTGLQGESSLRRVDILTGKVEQRLSLPAEFFGEGLAALGGKLYQLTYKEGRAFVYDLRTFKLEREFHYSGEGWGLTTDGSQLLMSNGSDEIRFLDPGTFEIKKTIHVTDRGVPVDQINELEWVKGEIYANIWKTQRLVCIDPATGIVRAWVELPGLLAPADITPTLDVLNGIAYDPAGDRLFVTGKFWPKLFQIRIVPR